MVGERFVVEAVVAQSAFGTRMRCRDQITGHPVALKVLPTGWTSTPEVVSRLRTAVQGASQLQQDNVLRTYGLGTLNTGAGGQSGYIATEWMDGTTLADALAQHAGTGRPMSLRGAFNVIGHVSRALGAAADAGVCHGAVRPSVVMLGADGRVKVDGFGLDRALVEGVGAAALGRAEQGFLAPEVKAGYPPGVGSDVFGLGGLLYAMLTGRTAADAFVRPSEVHPEATASIDRILLKCLAAAPEERFEHPIQVKDALVSAATASPPGQMADDEPTKDVELDVELGTIPPPPPRGMPGPGPRVGGAAQPPMASPAAAAEVDLSARLASVTQNDSARWMVSKDDLDHGPFSGRELVQLIVKGEVLGRHGLLNMDSGQRCSVAESPDFDAFVLQYELKTKQEDDARALVRSARREKTSRFVKVSVLVGLLAVATVGAALFVLSREASDEGPRATATLDDLYRAGEIDIEGTAGVLPDPPARSSRRQRRRGRGSMSYEDAMSRVVDLGSAKGSGSQRRLSTSQVAATMNRRIRSLMPCVAGEHRGGRRVGSVRIDMAIAGSGEVLGASVRNGSASFQNCIAARVRRIRFPSFSAPRMGATFSFSAE